MPNPIRLSLIFLPMVFGSWSNLCAQGSEIVNLKDIPPEGVLLDKGWKYKVGDNQEYASPDFDDITWDLINPAQDIHEIPVLWKDSVVWFRLHLDIDPKWVGDLVMTVSHAGASEFYLNGKMFRRYGVVSSNSAKIFAYHIFERPVIFPVLQEGRIVLAVRYVLEPGVHYTTKWTKENLGLSVRINTDDQAQKVYQETSINDVKNLTFRISAYLILMVLYLAFYISNPKQSSSLYFFVYALIWTIVWSIHYYLTNFEIPMRQHFHIANISLVLQVIGWLYGVQAFYQLFSFRKSWGFYSLVAFGILTIPLGIFVYGWGWYIYAGPFISLSILFIIRMAFLALGKKIAGALIIVIGASTCLILWILFLLIPNEAFLFGLNKWTVFAIFHLSLPVTVSIYFGYDFARTNRILEQKLIEVKKLSEEKTQILTGQKEILEKEVAERTYDLHASLENLKSTQSQLIQSEKLASLGQLTAGIAHEIKNPLNFVTNFSEVSLELVEEAREEVKSENAKGKSEKEKYPLSRGESETRQLSGEARGVSDGAKSEDLPQFAETDSSSVTTPLYPLSRGDLILSILNDIEANLRKIHEHGSRADSIVKSMLQHSRGGSGKMEPTPLNPLIKEYVNLAFHGMRAGNDPIDVEIELDLDETVGEVDLITEDFSRVILNLCNNAFDAMRTVVSMSDNSVSDEYKPKLTVRTKSGNGSVIIEVVDNGSGIPDEIKDKILQPFFTTKKGTQGTGLGLSITHDIVKAHGGELKVESKVNVGSEFIITLPVEKSMNG